MTFPVSGSTFQMSGNAVPNVTWTGKLLYKFYSATVLADISNTEYEGTIANFGDSVTIRTTPDITISDYSKGQALSIQRPEPSTIDLKIDKGKYWNFVADDVDKYQSDYEFIEDWTRDASEQLKITIDTDILGAVYASADANNAGATAGLKSNNINLGVTGTPLQLTKVNILDKIVDLGTVLDEQNVPESDRFIIFPPWACALVKKSDLRDASIAGDGQSILRNGRLGVIDGFTIYRSNLLTRTTDGSNTVTNIVAGQKTALTFASQFIENETLRGETTFGTIFRGLQVFGYKVIKPEAMMHLYAYQ